MNIFEDKPHKQVRGEIWFRLRKRLNVTLYPQLTEELNEIILMSLWESGNVELENLIRERLEYNNLTSENFNEKRST